MTTTTQKGISSVDELRDDIEVLRHFAGWAEPDTRTVMEAPPEPPEPSADTLLAPASTATAPALVSTFRCRIHTDQPVIWKGKGCPELLTVATLPTIAYIGRG